MEFRRELDALGDPFGIIEAAEDERLAELAVVDQVLCNLVVGSTPRSSVVQSFSPDLVQPKTIF